MKRDWDLIRDMLLKIEQLPASIDIDSIVVSESFIDENIRRKVLTNSTTQDVEKDAIELVNSHMKLLIEAGLIVGHCEPQECHTTGKFRNKQFSHYICYSVCLTWAGYDFLDAIRKQNTWGEIVTVLKAKGIELTIDTITAIAKQWTMQMISG